MLYGIPLALLVNVVMGIIEYYIPNIESKAALTIKGVLAVGCALLTMNLPDIETLLPWMSKYLPQLIGAVMIFASFIGVSDKARALTWRRLYSMRKNGLSRDTTDRGDKED